MRTPETGLEFEDLHFFQVADWLKGTPSTLGAEASRPAATAIESLLRKEEHSLAGVAQAEIVQHNLNPEVALSRGPRRRQDNQPGEQMVLHKLLALGGEFTHQHSVRVNELAFGKAP